MDYTILVIDDDEPIHVLLDHLLKNDYSVIHARNAQEGIDILSEAPVNLVLSDIHMPGISGLEFLETLMGDAEKKGTPVLIMTNLPNVEKEKKALELGAADFIDKSLLNDDRDALLRRVQMKLVTNIAIPDLSEDLMTIKKDIVKGFMGEVLIGDFFTISRKLFTELRFHFGIDHISFWAISGSEPRLIQSLGVQPPLNYGSGELKQEVSFRRMLAKKKVYMSNHIFNEEHGIFKELSKEEGLPAEIGTPLFAISEKDLIKNKMQNLEQEKLYGYVVLKRNKLFTTKEFTLISRLLIQSGTILWRKYQEI